MFVSRFSLSNELEQPLSANEKPLLSVHCLLGMEWNQKEHFEVICSVHKTGWVSLWNKLSQNSSAMYAVMGAGILNSYSCSVSFSLWYEVNSKRD